MKDYLIEVFNMDIQEILTKYNKGKNINVNLKAYFIRGFILFFSLAIYNLVCNNSISDLKLPINNISKDDLMYLIIFSNNLYFLFLFLVSSLIWIILKIAYFCSLFILYQN